MSSTAAAPSVNGSNANGPLSSAPSNSTGGRPHLKMNSSGKGADGARKQAGSPIDASQKKPPPPRAWQGTNPITQRPTNPTSNGVASAPRPSQNAGAFSGETASPMRHLNDRMMFLLANLSGLPGNITLKNGEKYTGVLSGTSLDPTEMRYVFKMVKKIQAAVDAPVNGTVETSEDYIGVGDNHVMAFDMSDVADFHVSNVVLNKAQSKGQNGVAGFRTDTDISGNMAGRERTLQRWEPSADVDMNLSLESSAIGDWDQFAAHERLTGQRSDFDENLYTTTIDRSHPQYAERAALAEKKAREIEGSSAMNRHVREERTQNTGSDGKDVDEEDLYSGVYRPLPSGQPNTYVPPSRRPPSGQANADGAPVDPAIISAQLARPGSTAAKAAQRTASPSTEKPAAAEAANTEAATKPETSTSTRPEASKDIASKPEGKPAPPTKPAADHVHKPSDTFKPTVDNPTPKQAKPNNATANVEHQLLDSFKQFSAAEKLRMSERQRTMARESKAVKLNDLKKFSLNFKLNTPVPQDLVPILAKDENKQQQIVDKALKAVQELKATPPKATATMADPKSVPRPTNVKPDHAQQSPSAAADRQSNQRSRPAQNQYASASMPRGHNPNLNQGQRPNQGLLSSRLQLNQQQHKQQGAMAYNGVPQPIPSQEARPPVGPSASSSSAGTPTSNNAAMRFNVRAHEFRPNPAANTFQPGGNPSNQSSPRPDSAPKQEAPRKPITSFFGGQRPTKNELDLTKSYNSVKRLAKEASQDSQKTRQYQTNGGIQPPYQTPPTWDFPQSNSEKSYKDMFERPSAPPSSTSHSVMSNGSHPHQHQIPPHFQGSSQGVPQGQTPQHTPRHPHVQPHHGQGPYPYEAQHMQHSNSNSSVHPSPRPVHGYMYPGQPQPMPSFPQQVPVQHYGMSPGVQHVGLRAQPGPQYVNPPPPGMGGQMMTNQPSNGPYMGMPTNPQMPMYSSALGHGYPQYPGQMPGVPGTNGFGSPRPGAAPLMSHQGSQQGHQQQPMMYMQHGGQGPPMFAGIPPGSMTPMRGPYPQPHQQPHFGSPHQHHQFPQQHHGTPSGSYAQPMMQQHSLPPQIPPTGPANHAPEGNEEGK